MSTGKSFRGLMFGATVFIALMPLAFTFSQNGIQFLPDTPFSYFVWIGQTLILLQLIPVKNQFSKKKSIALALLYLLVPFAFLFNENRIYFLLLNQHTSCVLSWAIAGVLLGKLFLKSDLKQDFLTNK